MNRYVAKSAGKTEEWPLWCRTHNKAGSMLRRRYYPSCLSRHMQCSCLASWQSASHNFSIVLLDTFTDFA